jgi:hypothetical protein
MFFCFPCKLKEEKTSSTMADECTLLDNKAKREIALKAGAVVFGIFAVLGNPAVWGLVGKLFNRSKGGSGTNATVDSAVEVGKRYPAVGNTLIKRLGGVKIGWGQTLLHALLAGLLTALITYLAMEPGKDRESCPKADTKPGLK